MSAFIYKIIPGQPEYELAEIVADKVLEGLRACVSADSIEIRGYKEVTFIDCGGNLQAIRCPSCGEVLDFDWWGEAMEKAGESGFAELQAVTPCCGKSVSLNDLQYDMACGFARCEVVILNPQAEPAQEVLEEIEKMLGASVKIVRAHY
ncbi:MAG: hypothetical protein IJ379_06165 [Lachnospiraceae bacterium]|nr:hypothetical protein [Lachnospiraceae bacterium]